MIFLLCGGCADGTVKDLPIDITNPSFQSTDNSTFVEGGHIRLQKVGEIPLLNKEIQQAPEIIFGTSVLFSRRNNGYTEYYVYNMETEKAPQEIAKADLLAYGSGSVGFTEGRYVWFAHDTPAQLNMMYTYRLDLAEKNCKVIQKQENFPPFKFFYKVDDTLLITYRPESLNNGEAYAYHIESLNTKTFEVKSLVTANTKEGTHIPCMYFANQQIYAILNLTEKKQTYVSVYDVFGKKVQDILLPIYGKRISSVLVKENYVFLDCIDEGVCCFRLSDSGAATQVAFSTKGFNTTVQLIDKNACIRDQYVILYDAKDCSLITYDSKTDRFFRYYVEVDAVHDKEKESIYPYISEEGKIYFITASGSAVTNTISEHRIFELS